VCEGGEGGGGGCPGWQVVLDDVIRLADSTCRTNLTPKRVRTDVCTLSWGYPGICLPTESTLILEHRSSQGSRRRPILEGSGSWAQSAVVIGDTSSPRQAGSLWVSLGLSSAEKVAAGTVAENGPQVPVSFLSLILHTRNLTKTHHGQGKSRQERCRVR